MEPKKKSRLREERKKRGIKQIDLAKEFDCSSSYICLLEYHPRKMRESWAKLFGAYFGVFWKKFMCD
jgi:transcriptional regulator with XRE-family HTH domain